MSAMRKTIAALLCLSMLLLSGCWDSREMNELGLVVAVGIDKAADSGNYVITVQIANPKPSDQRGTNNSSSAQPVFVMTTEGKTLFDAARQLSKTTSKRIMWAHNNVVVIGEGLARDGILPVIDFFTHNPELRLKTPIVVSEGDARKYITMLTSMDEIPGTSFSNIYRYANLTAQYIPTDLLSISQGYYGEFSSLIISKISLVKSKLMPGDEPPVDTLDQVQFGGAAVFRKDKMQGWLTPEETKGLAWTLNKTGLTIVTVAEPSEPNRYVSIETNKVNTKITATLEDGKPSLSLDVTGTGSIVEEDGTTEMPIIDLEKTLEGYVDEDIGNNIRMGLGKIQKDYQCDALNLAEYFHVSYRECWESSLEQYWMELYPKMPVSITVHISIHDSNTKQLPENNAK